MIPEWIRIGAVDFGFVNPHAVADLKTEIIKDGEMLAVLPQGHPLAGQKNIRLEDIADEPYIMLEEGQYSESMAAFEAAGIAPDIHYIIHDDHAIMTMVEAGLGVSILAELMLRRTNFHNVCLPIEPPIYRTLAVAYKEKESLPIASKYFIEYLLSHKDELP